VSRTYVFARSAPDAEYDRSLAWAALLLAALGLVMVYSSSIATAEASRFTGHNAAWYLIRQATFLAVAFGCALGVFLVPVKAWQKAAPWLFLGAVALLVLVLVTDVDDYGYYDQMGFGGFCDGLLCTQTPQPVQTLYDQLVTLKGGDPEALATIVVAGDPNVTAGMNTCGQPASCCGVGLGECAGAHHAPRLWEFAAMQVGSNGFTGNICEGAQQIPVLIQDALTNNIDLACQTYEPAG